MDIIGLLLYRNTHRLGLSCRASEPEFNTMSKRSVIVALVFIALVLGITDVRSIASPSLQEARVIAVNDGDTVTIRMNGRKYRARLVGIDAPERGQEPWGQRAREHLKKLLKSLHWSVLIETDIQPYDKYNRLLVYLWDDNKRLINEQMLLDGYAVLFTIQPNSRYADRLRTAQGMARDRKLGIWGQDGLKERPLDYKKKHRRDEKLR